ncbi:acid protease [Daedaleopsis nitida]|nr:acid protease [Daedaleopsis nitida]
MSRGCSSSFLSLLVTYDIFSIIVGATPVVQVRDNLIRLPVVKKFNFTGSSTILARDQARVKLLHANAKARLSGVPLSKDVVIGAPADNQVSSYIVSVGVGKPATQSPTFKSVLGAVSHGSGFFEGTLFTDTVTIAPGLVITGQPIGVAAFAEGFDGIDGIVGIGPSLLNVGTESPDTRLTINTVTDNLFFQDVITENLVAVSFARSDQVQSLNGEVTFGGTDLSKFTGSINFTYPYYPHVTRVGILGHRPVNHVRHVTSTNVMSKTAGIVDTGTTLVLLATDAFARYQNGTGAVFDDATGLFRITQAEFENLQSLFFTINGDLRAHPQRPDLPGRALNTAIGGDAGLVYLVIGSIGTPSGEGLDFINGQIFLERFYSVFDTTNSRVGFASTPFTNSNIN